jgi:hypothetical protein
MTANQTWFEGKKFHLVPAAFRTALSIIHEIEYFSQLVNKSDVDITLRIFDYWQPLLLLWKELSEYLRNN